VVSEEVDEMQQKEYTYMTVGKGALFLIGLLAIFFVFLLIHVYAVEVCEALYDIALKETVDMFRSGAILMMVFTLVPAIIAGIYFFGGFNAHTIGISDQGIELRRKRGSTLITKIESVVEVNPKAIRLEGVTSTGKPIKKVFGSGDVGKEHWQDFKSDLTALWERQQRPGTQPRPQHPPPPPPNE
jgi:hypothetical protein